ncbi:hypothetical protein R6Q59_033471 [Mikania micrantha]
MAIWATPSTMKLMADDHQFPTEKIYGILSKLPVISLARLQSTIHVRQEPTPIIFQQLLLPSSCQLQTMQNQFFCVIQGTIGLQKDPVLQFLWKGNPLSYQEKMVLGSCNGLILVYYQKKPTCLAIINPLSKQRCNLPPIKINSAHEGTGFMQQTLQGLVLMIPPTLLRRFVLFLKKQFVH